MAIWVDKAFAASGSLTAIEAWAGALSYTLQIYFDFSAYSEMAIGLGLLFNLKLPINFDSPYKSTSIIEFWRRWHISLSFFLKNYLYIPLGGNRHGRFKRARNLMITMFLGGLWHGAGWTFIIWGVIHGGLLIVNHLWRRTGIVLPRILCWLVTFLSVLLAWVFFRARTLEEAIVFGKSMIGYNGSGMHLLGQSIGVLSLNEGRTLVFDQPVLDCLKIITILIACLLLPNIQQIVKYSPNEELMFPTILPIQYWRYILLACGIILFVIFYKLTTISESPFLYYNF